jgi:hypothetical protein
MLGLPTITVAVFGGFIALVIGILVLWGLRFREVP